MLPTVVQLALVLFSSLLFLSWRQSGKLSHGLLSRAIIAMRVSKEI